MIRGGSTTPHKRICGVMVPLSRIALITLVLCTSALVLALRYSRNRPTDDGVRYTSSAAVVMSELLKMCVATMLYAREVGSSSGPGTQTFFGRLKGELLSADTLMLGVPGGLYLLQNNILFIALSHLDAATFQVTYQLKILTTAIFSMFMLGKTFTSQQWGALAMLFVGVAMVQMPKSDSGKHKGHEVPGPNDKTQEDYIIGITAVLMACCSSAFAGVYFERILKKQAGSLWLRNIQLGIFGFLLGVVGAFSKDGTELSERGFLHHFSSDVWLVVVLQALSGLVIASVIKHADNVLKTFANAASVVLSATISYVFLGDFHPTLVFGAGTSLVLFATYLYGKPAGPPVPDAKDRRIAELESELAAFTRELSSKDEEIEKLMAGQGRS